MAKENCNLMCSACDYELRETGTCCICGGEFENYGNNPSPIYTTECTRCCAVCDFEYVWKMRGFIHKVLERARAGKSFKAKIRFDADGAAYAEYKKSADAAMEEWRATEGKRLAAIKE